MEYELIQEIIQINDYIDTNLKYTIDIITLLRVFI